MRSYLLQVQGHQKQERNIRECLAECSPSSVSSISVSSMEDVSRTGVPYPRFLTSRGSVPLTQVMKLFSVPRRWLASHEEFLVPGHHEGA